jgi:CubicO group peptidase (beta-lactamase class C family)
MATIHPLLSLILGGFIIASIGCRSVPETKTVASLLTVGSNYKPPVFIEPDRESKILLTIPLADSIVKEFMRQEHLPGIAGGIVLNGKLIHTFYYGYTDLSKNVMVDSLSDFRIASMTKSFTAMAIIKLRDEGKLDLDDPVSKYIPEMDSLRYLSSDARPINIRDLLTHRAGFPEDNPYGDRQLGDTEDDLLNMIKESPAFSNVPGTSYEYSNLGFALLGEIIKNVSGLTYQQYITENIFQPLGMTHSYFDYTKVPSEHLAHGYRWINENWRDEALEKDGSWGAMGGLITTVEDFSRYVAFHLSAWPPRSDEDKGPVKRSSVREMHQPTNFNSFEANYIFPSGRACPVMNSYGYGLGILKDCNNRSFIGHGGGLPGFGSHWRIMPEYGIGVAIFSNRTYAPISRLTLTLLDTLLAVSQIKPYALPPSSILEQRKNELVSFLPLWNNATTSKIFAENFFADYPVEALKKESSDLFNRAGKIISVTAVKPLNQLRGNFNIECEKAIINITFTLTPEHIPTIQEYHIKFLPDKIQ